jgi:hypothetical protein
MIKAKTETGTLMDGIPFGDAVHVDYEIGLPLMRHNFEALDDTEEKYGTVEGFIPDSWYRCAILASTLVRLGSIPREELTAGLLHEHLTDDDYDILTGAQGTLRAKRSGGNPGSPDTDSPSSPSESTVLPKSE